MLGRGLRPGDRLKLLVWGGLIVGGMDNTLGVIVGAFLLMLLPEKLRFVADYRLLFVGVVVILS